MNIKEHIQQYIAENFLFGNGFDLSADASLIETGVIDSTGVMELVMTVEETYDIEVADDEIIPANFDSVNNIIAYIERKRG